MAPQKTLQVKGFKVSIFQQSEEDYISLTDIARNKNAGEPKDVVKNWMRSKSTIQFLAFWEQLNNPNFKGVEIDPFVYEAGSNAFTLSPSKWIEATNAIGLISKNGNHGGTYAHKDIAFEFASWVSPEFKLYLINEFQRLKREETNKLQLDWSIQRTLTKVNYRIHTNAIRENLIPHVLNKSQIYQVYASEADLLNVALFGLTAKEWREQNPHETGNIRDFASIEQLIVLSNLESINAIFIEQGLNAHERINRLNQVAISQMRSLVDNPAMKRLK